jgi:DNA-3-methyladenine glycosylase II
MSYPTLHDPDQRARARRELARQDPRMGELVGHYGDPWTSSRIGAFGKLARIIVGQQISVKAAATIFGRLEARCGGSVSAGALLATDEAAMQECGLSRQKRAALRDLAEHVDDGRLRPGQLWRLDDDSVRNAVTRVKGLGPWSAEVFLMFGLGRPDLLPVDDLGLRAGFRRFLHARRPPSPRRMEQVARAWRPWRTLACLYIWALLDNPPDRKNAP